MATVRGSRSLMGSTSASRSLSRARPRCRKRFERPMNARVITLVVCFASVAACGRPSAVAPEPEPPAGEVWLTAGQVADAKIEVAAVAEHDVDDTILTA